MSGPIANGFQGTVTNQPGVGQAGDFYGTNLRTVPLAGPGFFVAPAENLIVGHFCWADSDTGVVNQGYTPGRQACFLHRQNNAIIVDFLGVATYVVLHGLAVDLFTYGDFWALFAAGATPGQTVYADESTGAAIAASTAPVATNFTASIGASSDAHASATAGVLTVTVAPTVGVLSVGDTVTGTGVTGAPTIAAQLTGTPGGIGTYQLAPGTAAFAAATDVGSTSNVLHVTIVASGVLGAGDVVAGTTVTVGTRITSQLSGAAGGIGDYAINGSPQQITSEAMTVSAISTGWTVASVAGNGELAKITKWG